MVDISRALTIPGWMSEEELTWLAEQATHCKVIIEIGTYLGRSARAFADNLPDGSKLYCIDPLNVQAVERERLAGSESAHIHYLGTPGRCEEIWKQLNINLGDHFSNLKAHLLRMASDEAVGFFKDVDLFGEGFKADLVFIDGAHTFHQQRLDMLNYMPLVRRGGLLCGHDYSPHHPQVKRAVNVVCSQWGAIVGNPVRYIWNVRKTGE